MAVAMVMTCAATTAVAMDDETMDEVNIEWESCQYTEENPLPRGHNIHFESQSDILIALRSPASVAGIRTRSDYFPAGFPDDASGYSIKIIQEIESGGRHTTKFYLSSQFIGLTAEDVGKVKPNALIVTLTDGKTLTIPFEVTIGAYPISRLDAASIRLIYGGIAVGQSVTLRGVVDDITESLTPPFEWKWEIRSGSSFAKIEPGDGNTATLTGLAAGRPTLVVGVKGASSMSYRVDITGPLAPDLDLDGVKTDLAHGKDAALDVAPSKGLSASDLLGLKNSAKDGAKVELTFNNDKDLTLTFDPAAIPDDWSGKPFTPAFTPAMPEAAKQEGFSSSAGKWLDFSYSGALPAPMTVAMKVAPGSFPDGASSFKVWYFNPATKALTEQPVEVSYDPATATISFTLDHFSAYVVCPEGVDPNEGKQPPKPPVTDSGATDSGRGGSDDGDDENSVENLRLVMEKTLWDKTIEQLTSEEALAALPVGSAVINGKTVSAPLLTLKVDEVRQIPFRVVDRLAGRDILIRFTAKGMPDAHVHAASVAPCESFRFAYTIEDFLALYAPAE